MKLLVKTITFLCLCTWSFAMSAEDTMNPNDRLATPDELYAYCDKIPAADARGSDGIENCHRAIANEGYPFRVQYAALQACARMGLGMIISESHFNGYGFTKCLKNIANKQYHARIFASCGQVAYDNRNDREGGCGQFISCMSTSGVPMQRDPAECMVWRPRRP